MVELRLVSNLRLKIILNVQFKFRTIIGHLLLTASFIKKSGWPLQARFTLILN